MCLLNDLLMPLHDSLITPLRVGVTRYHGTRTSPRMLQSSSVLPQIMTHHDGSNAAPVAFPFSCSIRRFITLLSVTSYWEMSDAAALDSAFQFACDATIALPESALQPVNRSSRCSVHFAWVWSKHCSKNLKCRLKSARFFSSFTSVGSISH